MSAKDDFLCPTCGGELKTAHHRLSDLLHWTLYLALACANARDLGLGVYHPPTGMSTTADAILIRFADVAEAVKQLRSHLEPHLTESSEDAQKLRL